MSTIHTNNREALREILAVYAPPGPVLDMTYGTGAFWDEKPDVTLDLVTKADVMGSFYALPFPRGHFAVVVFDPPYRMNGTKPDYALTERYRNTASNYRVVPLHYERGILETYRVLVPGGILVVKMQDQVVSGRRYFQTNEALRWAGMFGRLLAEVHVVTGARPQPLGRKQLNIQASHSTFQVWQNTRRAKQLAALEPRLF